MHVNVVCHYLQANVNGCIFSLGDCAHIKVSSLCEIRSSDFVQLAAIFNVLTAINMHLIEIFLLITASFCKL